MAELQRMYQDINALAPELRRRLALIDTKMYEIESLAESIRISVSNVPGQVDHQLALFEGHLVDRLEALEARVARLEAIISSL